MYFVTLRCTSSNAAVESKLDGTGLMLQVKHRKQISFAADLCLPKRANHNVKFVVDRVRGFWPLFPFNLMNSNTITDSEHFGDSMHGIALPVPLSSFVRISKVSFQGLPSA